MKSLKLSTIAMGLALLGFSACGSSDTEQYNPFADADVPVGNLDSGVLLYGISPGTYCYKIASVSAVTDGCQALDLNTFIGSSVPGTYDPSTGIFTLGNSGSLGGGAISNNQGTLIRLKGTMSDPNTPGCSWNVEVSTALTMTAENQFTGAVTEKQDTIATACGVGFATCQTTWTGTFAIDPTQNAALGCK